MRAVLSSRVMAITVLALTLAGPPAWAGKTVPPNPEALRAAANAAEAGDCKTALRLVSPWLKTPGTIADSERLPFVELAASCAINTQQVDLAYSYALDGTRSADASDWLWRLRFAIEMDGKRDDAALATVTAMTQGRGAALDSLPVPWLYRLDNAFRDAGNTGARRRLLALLVDSAYQPDEAVPVADVFRLRYAELLYDGGDRQPALGLVRQIDTPALVMALSVDPRFRSTVPATYDARAAMIAYLQKLNAVAVRHPNSLSLLIEIASVERQLGRPEQALATLQAGDPNATRSPAYVDKDEQLNWWWDGIARAYEAAGDYDHAVAAMRQGAAIKEHGETNVSQAINLAEAQLRHGHPADALDTLTIFDRPGLSISPYGQMEMRFARGCAAKLAGKGDPSGDVAFAKAHVKDQPQALSDLLLCVGDLDGAAAAFTARLDDPAKRADALLELSTYDPQAKALTPDPVYGQIPALMARDDMKAVIARAGGTRRFNVQRRDL